MPAIDAVSGPDQCSAASAGSAPLATSSSERRDAEAPAEVAPDVRHAGVLGAERADVGAAEDAHEPVAERQRAREVRGDDQGDLDHGCAPPRAEVVAPAPEVVGERPDRQRQRDRDDDVASSRRRVGEQQADDHHVLRERLELAELRGADHARAARRDEPQPGHGELARDDHEHDPRAHARLLDERDQRAHHEQLVGERVEEDAADARPAAVAAGEVAVERVGRRGDAVGDRGPALVVREVGQDQPDDDRDDEHPRERDGVGRGHSRGARRAGDSSRSAPARSGRKESATRRRTAALVATPQIMPLDLVAWALFRRGRTPEEVAEQTGLDLEQALEAIIRGFRLTLEDG